MTKFSLLSLLALLLLVSCKQANNRSETVFNESIQNVEGVDILPTSTEGAQKIKLPKPQKDLKASQLVDNFKYIFLETTPESLIGIYCKVVIHKERIFILDSFIANNVFIFDLSGKFIASIPRGNGPGECGQIKGMFVDKLRDRLVVQDAEQLKFMFYTLDGDFTGKSIPIQLYFAGEFAITDADMVVYVTNKCLENPHVESLSDYRLLYTDSIGRVTKASFEYDDNEELATGLSRIFNGGNDLLYHPNFTSDFYQFTDNGTQLKYSVDLSNYSPIDIKHIQTEIHSLPELSDYTNEKTMLSVNFAETQEQFYFEVEDKKQYLFAFYDKETRETRCFDHLIFDSDFMIDLPNLYSDGEHFIGTIAPQKLKELSAYRQRENRPLDKELEEKIANLQEDDNAPLVLFTVK